MRDRQNTENKFHTFTFICEGFNKSISHSFEEESLPEIIDNFKEFLSGCGFSHKNIEEIFGGVEE